MAKRAVRRNKTQIHRHNEAKYIILNFLLHAKKYYRPEEIAQQIKFTKGSVRTRLSKMWFQGYIWRRNFEGVTKYRFLKPMGIRVLFGGIGYTGLEERARMRDELGIDVTFNLRKYIPDEVIKMRRRMQSRN